jgi:peptidoglycan/xylan/chitin deacetylase (PgdA/CDA1 family)
MRSPRRAVKRVLAAGARSGTGDGVRLLIYHRVGGGSPDERDVSPGDFAAQLDVLDRHPVRSLGDALKDLSAPAIVLTFDDGFADVYEHAWPLLRERSLPFTIYLATAYVGGEMHWDGSTARAAGPGLSWSQLEDMVSSGLATIGNHTHSHARPELVTEEELDVCSSVIERRLGVRPDHFADTWGVREPLAEAPIRSRFSSAALGHLGVNRPGQDVHALFRIPVRRTDPLPFFRAKLAGALVPERIYATGVRLAKRAGARA